MKSAIGEELTRKDHGDVSNQLVGRALILRMMFFFIQPRVCSMPSMRSGEMLPR